MSYTGDAYLTLKTRVQANPLNTYLSTRPSFASPQPLAANSSLTIPLQITLSDIRLSGFVILVFSKQKGITLVFRNDPLESLKVSSTFDSIPFVRDYLQKTIENQLRVLFMEDLPAIIHRLSLRMFSPEHQAMEDLRPRKSEADLQAQVDPFADPAADGSDADGAPFSLDPPTETYASFSSKNLLRLAALSESQRTLSLFTPSIRDAVYRAWTAAGDRGNHVSGTSTPTHRVATLARLQSSIGRQGNWSSSVSEASDTGSHSTRPTLGSMASGPSVYTLGSGRPRSHHQRKRKNRVVNLRKRAVEGETSDVASMGSSYDDSASASGSHVPSASGTQPTSAAPSQEREGELVTPPRSPQKKVGFHATESAEPRLRPSFSHRPVTPANRVSQLAEEDDDPTPRASVLLPHPEKAEKRPERKQLPRMQTLPANPNASELPRSLSDIKLSSLGTPFSEGQTFSGGILEQAWMTKMANEVAKRVAEEKLKGKWRRASEGEASMREDEAPPAYAS